MRATSTFYIILLNIMTLIISGKEYTMSCTFSNFPHSRMTSLALGPNRPDLLSTPTSNTLSYLLHQGQETKFHTHTKKRGEVITFHIIRADIYHQSRSTDVRIKTVHQAELLGEGNSADMVRPYSEIYYCPYIINY